MSNIVTRSSRPNDKYLLSGIFLRSGVLKCVYDLALEFCLEPIEISVVCKRMNKSGDRRTCLGNLGTANAPPPSPVANTRWAGRRTRFFSVPSGSIRVKLTIHVPEVSFTADVTVEEIQTLSSMILA
jgi:hypothetical protein